MGRRTTSPLWICSTPTIPPYGDRGTGDFSIEAGNSVTDLGAAGFDLTGAQPIILNATLLGVPISDPIAGQSFSLSDPGTYRYIKFEPHTVATSGNNCCGANNYGLNELKAFEGPVSTDGAAPEPGPMALLASGLAALALCAAGSEFPLPDFQTYRTTAP